VALPAARALVGALPGRAAPADPTLGWLRRPGVRPAFIVDLFTALGVLDAQLAAVATDHVLAWPATYDFDTVLVPANLTLLERPQSSATLAVQRLRTACIGHFEQRIARALEPPADWRRGDAVGCTCEDCRALGRFLGDASQKSWVFAAAAPRRTHVEATIRQSRCDVDFATEKRGSPHRLVCTKNQASYERRCTERANDLRLRAKLAA
jgi:hypothetical protein